jgi:hypothetical protein
LAKAALPGTTTAMTADPAMAAHTARRAGLVTRM